MSTPIRFMDHSAFHTQVLRVCVASAGFSFVLFLMGQIFTLSGGAAEVIVLTLSAAVLGLAAIPPRRPALLTIGLFALGIGLLATLARQALVLSPPVYPWFGVGLYGLAIGIIAGRDLKDFRRYVLPLATALSVALATWVVSIFRVQVDFTAYVPSFLAEPAYGALFGFIVSIGLLARQIALEQDEVAEAFSEVRPTLNGEMLELSDRAVSLYRRIQQVLRDRIDQGAPTEPDLSTSVKNLVLKIIHLGPKWNQVEKEVGQTNAEALQERLSGLEQKINQTSDEVARKQYIMARAALNSQAQYLKDISRSRERVMARVHNYLATLERLHLAVINHRGADAAKLSDEIQPILDEIDTIGNEMDYASEAISEVSVASELQREKEKSLSATLDELLGSELDDVAQVKDEPNESVKSGEAELLAVGEAGKALSGNESKKAERALQKAGDEQHGDESTSAAPAEVESLNGVEDAEARLYARAYDR